METASPPVPERAAPDALTTEQRARLLTHLDAIDAVDRAHTTLTKAARALKKLGGKTMADGVEEAAYREAVRADDEASVAYQTAKRETKTTEKNLAASGEALTSFAFARKADREALRKAVARQEAADVPETTAPKQTELERSNADLARRIGKDARERAGKPKTPARETTKPLENHQAFQDILDELARGRGNEPEVIQIPDISEQDHAPEPAASVHAGAEMPDEQKPQNGFLASLASRLPRSRPGRAFLGLFALLGIGSATVGGPKAGEAISQEFEAQEQAEALQDSLPDLAEQASYAHVFDAGYRPADSDVIPYLDGTTMEVREARQRFAKAYTKGFSRDFGGSFDKVFSLCGFESDDGEALLDPWKCHILVGDQWKPGKKPLFELENLSGVDERINAIARETLMSVQSIDLLQAPGEKHHPKPKGTMTLLAHGDAAGTITWMPDGSVRTTQGFGVPFFNWQDRLPDSIDKDRFFQARLDESLDLIVGVSQTLDLPDRSPSERGQIEEAMRQTIKAHTDLEIEWALVGSLASSRESFNFDSLFVGVQDSQTQARSTPHVDILQAMEARDEIAFKTLAAFETDANGPLHRLETETTANVHEKDVRFFERGAQMSQQLGGKNFWQVQLDRAERQILPGGDSTASE